MQFNGSTLRTSVVLTATVGHLYLMIALPDNNFMKGENILKSLVHIKSLTTN